MSDGFLSTEQAYSDETSIEDIELPDGESAKIEVRVATLDEVEEFEERQDGDELGIAVIQEIFNDYIIRPEDLDASQIPMPRINSLMSGVLKAWGVEEDELDEFLEERQGN